MKAAFEVDAEPYGYDLTIGNDAAQFIRDDVPFVYADEATNHRWLGFLAAYDRLPALKPPAEQPDALLVRNLAMLVTRMAHRLSTCEDAGNLHEVAMEFLQRNGLQGSPLRTDHIGESNEMVQQPAPVGEVEQVTFMAQRIAHCKRRLRGEYCDECERSAAAIAALKDKGVFGEGGMKLYNFRFDRLPVTVHLAEDRRFAWQRVIGLQVGDWFFGCIKGKSEGTEGGG